MFDALLESHHPPFGLPRWGLAVAVGLHAAILAAVLRPPAPPPPQPLLIGTEMPPAPEQARSTRDGPAGPALPPLFDLRLPPIPSPAPLPGVPEVSVPSPGSPPVSRSGPSDPGALAGGTDVLPASLVEEPPVLLTAPVPLYPERLRVAGVTGLVTVQVVVDTTGRPEPGSLQVVQSTNPDFENAAVATIRRALFRPGRVWGRAVRVLVQVPVAFRLQP